MITLLRRFYCRNFCPVAKADLLELFERNPDLCRVVILVEMSPLAGVGTTYSWQEFPERCRLIIREVNSKKNTKRIIIDLDLPKDVFAGMFQQLEEEGNALGSFSGKVKDGIFYSICWGNPSTLVVLSINNPQCGSKRHQEFIEMLKNRAKQN